MTPAVSSLIAARLPRFHLLRTALATVTALVFVGTPPPSAAEGTPAPANAYLYIGYPNNGQKINARQVWIWFGLRNMGVAPAGVDIPNTGHHHLLIDTPLPPFDRPIPSDKNHLHFGGGQTETTLDLTPGRHTLQLLLGDKDHRVHNPPVYSEVVVVTIR